MEDRYDKNIEVGKKMLMNILNKARNDGEVSQDPKMEVIESIYKKCDKRRLENAKRISLSLA